MEKKPKLTVDKLRRQIQRIRVDWLNDRGRRIINAIDIILSFIARRDLTPQKLAYIIKKYPEAIEVLRLIIGSSKDELTNDLLLFLKERTGSIPRISDVDRFCVLNPDLCAEFFFKFKRIGEILKKEAFRTYTYKDVLIERLKASRGRAIKGQKRGAFLEDKVEEILREVGLPFTKNRNFKGIRGQEAKADFAIPSHDNPIVIIEVKAYEATGSKQTDVLGDILKIITVKPPNVKFYFVTNGIGWLRRQSDLEKVVEHYNKGNIDRVFTITTLSDLKEELSKLRRLITG